jgi:TPR repeat protein
MKRSFLLVIGLLSAFLLTGCERDSIFACEPVKDWGIESLGMETPALLPFDTAKLDMQAIAPLYTQGVPVIAALVAGRYPDVDGYFNEVSRRPAFQDQYIGISQVTSLLQRRGLYLLPMTQAWFSHAPESKAAKLMLGLAFSDAAFAAHGGGYASQTTREQMAVYRQRLSFAMPLLEALAKDDDAIGLTARGALLHGYFLSGRAGEGWAVHDEFMEKLPLLAWSYITALEYAHPKWSGDRSEERGAHVLLLAEKNGLEPQRRKLLSQIVESHRNDIERNGDPKAWRPYWTARVEEVPGEFNLRQLLYKELGVQNWTAIEKVAQRIIDLNPGDSAARYNQAFALQQLGKNEEAFSAMVSAAVAGSDGAMGSIVYSYVKGTLGRRQQDFDTMYEYCKFGAALGLPSAANCMASSYTDGFGGAKRDDLQAVKWHLFAARGGEINSMHDLGVLLPRVVPSPDGQMAAAYWMRKAADAKHVYAMKKVYAQPTPVLSLGCRLGNKPAELMGLMIKAYVFFRTL